MLHFNQENEEKKINIGLSTKQLHVLKYISLPLFIIHWQYFGERMTNPCRENPREGGVHPNPQGERRRVSRFILETGLFRLRGADPA